MEKNSAPVRVRVPGSTSNLGPCFDLCGLAVQIYIEVAFEPCDEGLSWTLEGEGADLIRRTEDNLVLEAAQRLWRLVGFTPPGLNVRIHNAIPLYSGLGSSGAAVAAGLVAANALAGAHASLESLLALGTEIEGHPDNVTASLLGGLVLSCRDGDRVHSLSYRYPKPLSLAVLIPQAEISTRHSRQSLPDAYTSEDAVFNVSHAAQLAAAFASGRLEEAGFAFEDRFHQPPRAQQMPYLFDAIAAARAAGAFGAFLSGSGPSVGALGAPETIPAVLDAFRAIVKRFGLGGRVLALPIDYEGAQILA